MFIYEEVGVEGLLVHLDFRKLPEIPISDGVYQGQLHC